MSDTGANARFIEVRRGSGWLCFGNTAGAESIAMNGSTLLVGFEPDSQGSATRLAIKGSGSTSATTSLLVQNSGGTQLLSVNDSGTTTLYNGLTVQYGGINATAGLIQTTGNITATGGVNRIGNIEILTSGNAGSTGFGISAPGQLEFQGYNDAYTSTGVVSQFLFRRYDNNQVTPLVPAQNHGLITLANTGWNNSGSNGNNLRLNALWLEPVYNLNNAIYIGNIVRGIYYNPTLTSLTNTIHYGIQTTSGGAYINTATPQASACLQADSTTQGFLPPRMTTAQRTAIASPAASLIVFDTDLQNLCYRRDGVWVQATFAAV
jgi:hypothetical protein